MHGQQYVGESCLTHETAYSYAHPDQFAVQPLYRQTDLWSTQKTQAQVPRYPDINLYRPTHTQIYRYKMMMSVCVLRFKVLGAFKAFSHLARCQLHYRGPLCDASAVSHILWMFLLRVVIRHPMIQARQREEGVGQKGSGRN